MRLAQTIYQLRIQKGMSQGDLAEALEVSRQSVSKWETGGATPDLDKLVKMSELFGVTVNEILCGKRLNAEEYKAEAEKNLVRSFESIFTVKERLEFFKKKWLYDHIALLCFMGIAIIGIYILGFILERYILGALSFVIFALCHAWRNNAMMSYAEKKVFEIANDL